MTRATPIFFVLLWATGFVVARLVAPHADPLTFLVVRFGLSSLVFAAIAAATGAPWPRSLSAWRNLVVVGVLMQGVYLGGVFWAVRHGLPAGLSALVTGLQPLLTPILACVFSMVGTTLGTIWQKRTGAAADLRTSGAVQFGAASLVLLPFALALEPGRIDGGWQVLVGLAWGVFGLSLGAVTLLLVLIRRGAVAGVASLMYLVPPVAAGLGYWWFGDVLGGLQIAGMAVAAVGVWVASRD